MMTSPGTTADRVDRGKPTKEVELSLRTRVTIALGVTIIKLLGKTWRIRVIGREALDVRRAGTEPVVLTFWHGQMLMCLCGHATRTGILISEHRDGEIISRIVARFGHFSIRGSSSRGGSKALLEAVRMVRAGADVAFTPDGPRGPLHSYAPGALILAQRGGVPVVTMTAFADRVWRLRSWDRFEIPKPFSRVTLLYGQPLAVEAVDARAAAARTHEFAAHLSAELERVAKLASEHE